MSLAATVLIAFGTGPSRIAIGWGFGFGGTQAMRTKQMEITNRFIFSSYQAFPSGRMGRMILR
jgi:hypothetical protein